MSNYTDEERAAILASAKETLARTAHIKADPLANHYRRPREPEPEPRQDRLTDYEAARLRIDLTNMVASERAFMFELLPELIAHLRREITAEIEEKIGLVQADVNMHRAIDKSENVTELPSFLRKPA